MHRSYIKDILNKAISNQDKVLAVKYVGNKYIESYNTINALFENIDKLSDSFKDYISDFLSVLLLEYKKFLETEKKSIYDIYKKSLVNKALIKSEDELVDYMFSRLISYYTFNQVDDQFMNFFERIVGSDEVNENTVSSVVEYLQENEEPDNFFSMGIFDEWNIKFFMTNVLTPTSPVMESIKNLVEQRKLQSNQQDEELEKQKETINKVLSKVQSEYLENKKKYEEQVQIINEKIDKLKGKKKEESEYKQERKARSKEALNKLIKTATEPFKNVVSDFYRDLKKASPFARLFDYLYKSSIKVAKFIDKRFGLGIYDDVTKFRFGKVFNKMFGDRNRRKIEKLNRLKSYYENNFGEIQQEKMRIDLSKGIYGKDYDKLTEEEKNRIQKIVDSIIKARVEQASIVESILNEDVEKDSISQSTEFSEKLKEKRSKASYKKDLFDFDSMLQKIKQVTASVQQNQQTQQSIQTQQNQQTQQSQSLQNQNYLKANAPQNLNKIGKLKNLFNKKQSLQYCRQQYPYLFNNQNQNQQTNQTSNQNNQQDSSTDTGNTQQDTGTQSLQRKMPDNIFTPAKPDDSDNTDRKDTADEVHIHEMSSEELKQEQEEYLNQSLSKSGGRRSRLLKRLSRLFDSKRIGKKQRRRGKNIFSGVSKNISRRLSGAGRKMTSSMSRLGSRLFGPKGSTAGRVASRGLSTGISGVSRLAGTGGKLTGTIGRLASVGRLGVLLVNPIVLSVVVIIVAIAAFYYIYFMVSKIIATFWPSVQASYKKGIDDYLKEQQLMENKDSIKESMNERLQSIGSLRVSHSANQFLPEYTKLQSGKLDESPVVDKTKYDSLSRGYDTTQSYKEKQSTQSNRESTNTQPQTTSATTSTTTTTTTDSDAGTSTQRTQSTQETNLNITQQLSETTNTGTSSIQEYNAAHQRFIQAQSQFNQVFEKYNAIVEKISD